ncbi:MAG TPA: hypothetical protein PLX62_12805 [Bacteroidales bacterium]|jgi:hypothetical protein|nr:hypothetical protein [Bacteroidales bacterium]
MNAILLTMIAFIAIVGVASADYVQYTSPAVKDLSGLNMSEIEAIFAGDGTGWVVSDAGGAGWTPSINAFLADNGEGVPGNVTKKIPLRCGGV